MKFDEVLETHVGSCGRYQKLMIFLLSLSAIFSCIFMMEILFSGGHMDHWCKVPQLLEGPNGNYSREEWLNRTVPWLNDKGHWKRDGCNMYTSNVSYVEKVIGENGTHGMGNMSLTECTNYEYDRSTFKSTIVSEWDIVCDKSYYISFIKSFNLAGKAIGLMFGGPISDRIGRKKVIIGSFVIMLIGRIAISFSYNLTVFLVSSFLTMVSVIILYGTTFTLSVELVGPRWRAAVGALHPAQYGIGYIVVSGIAFFCNYRQTLHLAITIPLLLLVPVIWLAPESPRWLFDNGNREEATKVLHQLARRNGRKCSSEIKLEAYDKTENDETKKNKTSYLRSIKQLFTSKVLIVRVLINLLAWFTANMTYYGLTMNIQALAGDIYTNLAIAGSLEVLAAVLGPALISSRLGRRGTTCGLYLVSGLSLLLVLAVPEDKRMISTILALFGRTCCSSYFTIIYIWTAELFPTSLRNSSISLSSAAGKIGGILAPFLAELSSVSEVLPMVILGGLSIAAGLLLLFLPETKGAALPQTVDDMLHINKLVEEKVLPVSTALIKPENGLDESTAHRPT